MKHTNLSGPLERHLHLQLELRNEEQVLSGDTLRHLLQEIRNGASLTLAARTIGVSYRHAWGLLKESARMLGVTLVETVVGGTGGGGSRLTAGGEALLRELSRVSGEASELTRRLPGEDSSPEELLFIAATREAAETGLLGEIAAAALRDTGMRIGYLAAGSGTALKMARSGRIDLVFSHAPELERLFVSDGWGDCTVPFMQSTFVIIGPAEDPAGVRHAAETGDSVAAFRLIGSGKAPFISRGDNSGTHLREKRLWHTAGISPGGHWYRCYPEGGNRELISRAAAEGAYALVDAATVRLSGFYGNSEILYQESSADSLADHFSLIPVSSALIGRRNHRRAQRFLRWLEQNKEVLLSATIDATGKPLFSSWN